MIGKIYNLRNKIFTIYIALVGIIYVIFTARTLVTQHLLNPDNLYLVYSSWKSSILYWILIISFISTAFIKYRRKESLRNLLLFFYLCILPIVILGILVPAWGESYREMIYLLFLILGAVGYLILWLICKASSSSLKNEK